MKGLTKKLVVLLIAVMVIGALFVSCGQSESAASDDGGQAQASSQTELDKIIKAGVIRIALPQDTPPYGTINASGDIEGYDVDVAQLIADTLEVDLGKVPVISKNRVPFLVSDKVDLVISSMGATPSRAQSIWFSNPYGPFFWGMWGPAGIDIDSADETGGYVVGATLGTLEEIAFSEVAPDDVEIKRYDDQATTVQAFLSGQVELIVTGSPIASNMIKQNPDKDIQRKFIIQHSPCHIGVKKGASDLLNFVNVLIYRNILSGELSKIAEKWFGESLPELPAF